MSDFIGKPFAIHPRMREQIEKNDASRPAGEKVLKEEKKTKTKIDPKMASLKSVKAHIIENKPKKKEVREYYKKMIAELSSSDSE